jgi:transcriptional regulator with XRE-family HTH domain
MSTPEAYDAERAEYLKGFGANVRRLRAERGLTQTDLHNATNLHRTEIGRIEGGGVEPRLLTLVILAHGLDASLNDLVAGLPVPEERKPSPEELRRRASG